MQNPLFDQFHEALVRESCERGHVNSGLSLPLRLPLSEHFRRISIWVTPVHELVHAGAARQDEVGI